MEPQKLSHSSKNSHEKAPFDLGAELHGPQQLGHVDVFMHGAPMCYGTLTQRCLMGGLQRDGGREGWGREEEKEGGGCPFIPPTTRTFLKWTLALQCTFPKNHMSHDIFKGLFVNVSMDV
ncbi:hypothetical protein N7453_007935 [Penicillium expansum]|nr:hypothetical protein N7453_007935 [Penicillium expansum]